eukprot:CAMPEP_0117571396 /NCGR_PEP_ID=MMETSP0784-20121206/59725_1 /TAXON_ID=39447 /ORGANISM="" /LENGTH=231 /DNA_ID=CAMNT_0005369545 /DNA_START=187 /DNA_END=879 /DNA_ORIENTATION=-
MCSVRASVGSLAGVKPFDSRVDSSSDESDTSGSLACTACPPASPELFDIFEASAEAAVQTDAALDSSCISVEPDVIVSIAVSNAIASLVAFVHDRLPELERLAGEPLPRHVPSSLAGDPSPLPGIDEGRPIADRDAIDSCRRHMARLLVSWNQFAADVKSSAMPSCGCLDDAFLHTVGDALTEFLLCSNITDPSLMIDFAVLADRLASQVVIGDGGWLAHLASAYSLLQDW